MTAAPLLITRPEPQASAFAQRALKRLGPRAVVVSPLMQIDKVGALPELPPEAEIVLTSASALAVLDHAERRRLVGRRAWCVGPRTTAAATDAGMRAVLAGADAAALVDRLADLPAKSQLVHLRGVHAAAPLGDWLAARGIALKEVIVYDQRLCPLTDEARALLTRPGRVLVPLFSPRSASAFVTAVAGLELRAEVAVSALSPAVAAACAALPMSGCRVAATPDLGGMLDALVAIVAA
jgi:uroporphyrinogen-III synthase